jgi:hypothetical protein
MPLDSLDTVYRCCSVLLDIVRALDYKARGCVLGESVVVEEEMVSRSLVTHRPATDGRG